MRISNSDRLGKIHLARLKRTLVSWRGIVFESLVPSGFHIPQAEASSALLQLVHAGVLRPSASAPEERCWGLGEYGRQIMEATIPPPIRKEHANQLARKFLAHLEELGDRPDMAHYIRGFTLGPEYFWSTKRLPFVPIDVYVLPRDGRQLDARVIELQLSEFSEHLLVSVNVGRIGNG